MNLSLGFSPCPNDTFIFYALLHQKIPTGGLTFEPVIADVEALNLKANRCLLDITKISFNAFLAVADQYVLLDSGAALGRGCGPLLISKNECSVDELRGQTVVIPGEKTTANFLLDFFLPFPVKKLIKRFDEIENSLLSGEADAGVIIHENRFTYANRGLRLIQDLGSYWETQTGQPIPLGGIIAKRSLPPHIQIQVSDLIARSITYAWAHPDEVLPYVRQYAQEMNEDVMQQHINLYVNEYTADLGEFGRKAVERFFQAGREQGRVPVANTESIFLGR
ncbi:MAG: 1,4-dihydroxy-6-naphthoate synthase [Saprospiraceae bacterium]|nr:1,4-dihydroxy-6-naphthoate synthase [Saprospiraceae bacterium]